jgi:alanine-glyoxylate transaminase/serine-glyoxylate transaminase/serine-pyruvate transaminase
MPTPLFPTEKLLLGPGPCNVSARVRGAMALPLLGHMDKEFLGIMDECKGMLREIFDTKNEVTFPVSGTGSAGMDFLMVNFVEPGTRVLVAVNGVFGGRIANVSEKIGGTVHREEFPWGTPATLERMTAAAESFRPDIICLVSGETSTGVYQDFAGFSELARKHDALLLADCVTSLAGMPVHLDAWGVDLAYSGTQKCLACPPGLSPVTVSARALERHAARRTPVPSFYLDLNEILKYVGSGSGARAYHHTAPVSMVFALHQALAEVLEEGLPARWKRHHEAARHLISELRPLGFEPLVEEPHRLHPLTTLKLPEGFDEAGVRAKLLSDYRIEVGGGLGPLAGKIWRIGLMGGNASRQPVATLLGALKEVLG